MSSPTRDYKCTFAENWERRFRVSELQSACEHRLLHFQSSVSAVSVIVEHFDPDEVVLAVLLSLLPSCVSSLSSSSLQTGEMCCFVSRLLRALNARPRHRSVQLSASVASPAANWHSSVCESGAASKQ